MSRKERIVCGLDVGTCKTCLIVARVQSSGTIEMIGSGYSVSSGLTKGIVVSVPEVAESVRRAAREVESKSDISVTSVIVGISGDHFQSNHFRGAVPIQELRREVTAKDMGNAIRAAQSIPLAPERQVLHVLPQEFILDNRGGIKNPVGLSGSQLDVNLHVISCDGSLSQSLINAVNMAQIRVKRLIFQCIACGEAVLTPEEKELGTAIVDIGAGTTSIAVFSANSVTLTSVIPVGGSHFTRDLVEGLSTSYEDAERIKVQLGNVLPESVAHDELVTLRGLGTRGTHNVSRKRVCEYLHDRGAELLEFVRNDIFHSGHKLIGGAVLTGGGSMIGGILELAERILDMPVRQGLPMGFKGLENELAHPTYACAVGLVIMGAQGETIRDFKTMPFSAPSLVERILSWFEK